MNVFISYAQADEEVAKKVGEGLRRAGLHVWDVRREMLPGDLWSDTVSKALRASDAMIVLVTADAARSSQVRSEIDLDRKSTRLNSSHQIISYAVFCLKKKKITSIY